MNTIWKVFLAVVPVALGSTAGVLADVAQDTSPVTRWEIVPTSLVSRAEPPLQKIDLSVECSEAITACVLRVWSDDRVLAEKSLGAMRKGANDRSILLNEPEKPLDTRWVLSDGSKAIAEQTLTWNPPRHWTLYVIKSAHVDIGLHDSQYKQRLMTVDFIDRARRLADQTADWPEGSRFRYAVEGLWWWLNYPRDRSEQAANEVVEKYVKQGTFDMGASHSGNHTQAYGMEQMCRSAYCIRELRNRWNVAAETMLMVDNNGISWPLVTAYADAGIKYLAFLPNAWNPDARKEFLGWGVNASRDHMGGVAEGGGSRIDVGWKSELPHLFYWQGPDDTSRLLVWTSPTYTSAGHDFGIQAKTSAIAESKMARQLDKLETRYPYDIWLVSFYCDNEAPSLRLPSFAKQWNADWRWPEIRTLGDLSEPFRKVEARFGSRIPTLDGMITGGWAQHPVSTPTLLAKKRAADRLLPVAEKLATMARLGDPDFIYPTLAFRRAWDALVCNDEHGYGTSYYKGRPVYDTWMQKRDWIEQALATATEETTRALRALAALVPTEGPSVFVFNPTLQPRCETIDVERPKSCSERCAVRGPDGTLRPATVERGRLRFRTSEIPPMGYALFPLADGDAETLQTRPCDKPPTVENVFYRVSFGPDGFITGIFDKQLKRELVDASAPYRCNQFVYTKDTHKSFSSPADARFEIVSSPLGQTVIAYMDDPISGAAVQQRVTLPTHERRIDIDNRLDHVRDLASKDRWRRFGYYAFPWDVPQCTFRVGLNGCSADPYEDQTGHATDTYHAARDWAYVGNEQFGITIVQVDSQLVECGRIHERKNTFGEGPGSSHLYSYIFNDWLYGHAYVTGPSHINLRYRYVITTHRGGFEEAGAAQFAKRVVTPVLETVIPQAQQGRLPARAHSFLSIHTPNISLLTLKLSEAPGRGVIARFHETDGRPTETAGLELGWGEDARLTRCSIIEKDRDVLRRPTFRLAPFGYATLRIEQQGPLPAAVKLVAGPCSDKSVTLRWSPVAEARQYYIYRGERADFTPDAYHLLATTRQTSHTDDWLSPGATYHYRVAAATADARQGAVSEAVHATTRAAGDSPPAKVGLIYTGLITTPRAWRGDDPDTLYLQWGQNTESDLSHYEVYRGDTPDFELSESTFLAKVEPGPYVVVSFVDKGLPSHSTHYYRICAVDRDGQRGQPSDVCRGVTREMK